MTHEEIQHMVARFLSWRLPDNFNPDAGIKFDPVYNLGTEHQGRHEPTGTNLLDAQQAEAMIRHMVNDLPRRRLQLCESSCAVRDDRWSIHIDAGEQPCRVVVRHRKYGSFYDWPEAVAGDNYAGGVCAAADRAYTMEDESNFRTRSAAMKAAHNFIRRFGAGEVEYLEWDIDSQSMVVVGHQPRRHFVGWFKDWDDKPDPIEPFYRETAA